MKTTVLILSIIILVGLVLYFLNPRRPQCYGLYLGQNINSNQIETISKTYGQRPSVTLTFV
ncbi:MAG: hypothetical protein WCQ47_07195 [bacterium]